MTERTRYQIPTLLKLVISIVEITQTVKFHCATVYLELKRTRQQNCPQNAHSSSASRRKAAQKYRIPVERIKFVRQLLCIDWSPKQTASALTYAGSSVSHK